MSDGLSLRRLGSGVGGYRALMSDPVPASTRTIWIVAAAVFAIAFLVTAFSGSIFMALLCLIAAGACAIRYSEPRTGS